MHKLYLLLVVLSILLNLVASNLLLSCRVIESICQEDGSCLEEMHHRFPHCLPESTKRTWEFGAADKRAQAMRPLTRILLQLDRIPSGR